MHWTNATPIGRSTRSTSVLGQDGHATNVAPEPTPDDLPDPRPTPDEGEDGAERRADAWVRAIDPAVGEDRPDDDGGRGIPRLRRVDRA